MSAKPPKVYTDCDRPGQVNRAKCRMLAEAAHCVAHPFDPWCKERREKRARDRQILLVAGALVLLYVWLDR